MAKTPKPRFPPPQIAPPPPPPDRFARVLDELNANGDPLELVLRPTTALALAGLVNAGLRSRTADDAVAPYGDAFVRAVRTFFRDAPVILELLERRD